MGDMFLVKNSLHTLFCGGCGTYVHSKKMKEDGFSVACPGIRKGGGAKI